MIHYRAFQFMKKAICFHLTLSKKETMEEGLEALICLSQMETMAAAASRLRVGTSAISKRIAQLEDLLGYKVIEKSGRKVRLTSAGRMLIERAAPALSELKAALSISPMAERGYLKIGISESILASWAPKALSMVKKKLPELELKLSAHRSPVVAERVLSGEYALGLCAGYERKIEGLEIDPVLREEFLIIPSGLKKFQLRPGKTIDLISIEEHSATWQSIKTQLRSLSSEKAVDFRISETLQSFSAIVQLAKAGHGHALVPWGIASAMAVRRSQCVELPRPGIFRPVSLISRPSNRSRAIVSAFIDEFQKCAQLL